MTTNEKKFRKAKKHLTNARYSLNYWRERYVQNERETNRVWDMVVNYNGETVREENRREILEQIKQLKERIAKFERIVY